MKLIKQVKRTFGKDLDFVIFFVTNRCNSRCKHCFFWKELNKKGELSLEEIRKTFESIGKIRDVSLSGGEPILRDDILEIIDILVEKSKIQSLSIPSNGLLPDKLFKISESIVKKYPKLKLLVNLSIDGPEKVHDSIRGVNGNFKKSVECAKKLIELRERHNNLYVNLNSVVINKNIDVLPEFMNYVKNNLDVDGHYFEVIRGDSKDKDFAIPSVEKLKDFYKIALDNEEFYFKKRFNKKRVGLNLGYKMTRRFYTGIINYLYIIQMKTIKGEKWPFRCLAGQTSLVIYPKGDVSVCELLPSIGNLRDYDFDMKKLINSDKWKEKLKMIKDIKCSCTHDCFIYNTINHTPIARFFYVPCSSLK